MVVGAITARLEAVSSKSPPPQHPYPGVAHFSPAPREACYPQCVGARKKYASAPPKNGQTLSAKLNARTLILPNFPHAGSRSWFSHGIPAPKRHPPIRNAKGVAGRDKTSRQDLEIARAGMPAPFRVLDSAPLSFREIPRPHLPVSQPVKSSQSLQPPMRWRLGSDFRILQL